MDNKDKQIKDLTEQNDALENYFRNTIIPQLFIDADLVLRKFTPAAMKQFKLSPDDIGRSIHDVVNHLRFPSIIENIQQVIGTAEILEKEIQTTDLRWFQMNVLPYVEKKDDRPNGVIMTFIDITRRIKDLQEQEKLISDHETLLDTLSHDIKNPLTNILLSVELLKGSSTEMPTAVIPVIKVMENGIRKLQEIIMDLTDTRKGQQLHKYEAVAELLDIGHIIEDVTLTLLEAIRYSGAVVTTELEVSEIFFSRRKLRSILYNLLSNAVKFRSPDRTPAILIRAVRENDLIILTVRDNGIGIEAAKQKEVFEKYYRINGSVEGSGIGLHLVKELVTNGGGKIAIESTPGKGTTFTIRLSVK